MSKPEEKTKMSVLVDPEVDPWSGLTDRQKFIQRLKLRDMTNANIAKVIGATSQEVSKELVAIKAIHRQKGITLNKDEFIGGTVTAFEELEAKAWELFYTAGRGDNPNTAVQLQCIQAIAAVLEKKTKLLMDVGLVEKASTKHDHRFQPVGQTIIDTWDSSGREKLAAAILTSQLKELPEPEPDETYFDAEYEIPEKEEV